MARGSEGGSGGSNCNGNFSNIVDKTEIML